MTPTLKPGMKIVTMIYKPTYTVKELREKLKGGYTYDLMSFVYYVTEDNYLLAGRREAYEREFNGRKYEYMKAVMTDSINEYMK